MANRQSPPSRSPALKLGGEKPAAPPYMTTLADMSMLMLCIFVMLYSMSSIDSAKFRKLAQSFTGTRANAAAPETYTPAEMTGSGILEMPEKIGLGSNPNSDIVTVEPEEMPLAAPPAPETADAAEQAEQTNTAERDASEARERFDGLAARLRTYFAENRSNGSVSIGEGSILLTLAEGVTFDQGKANLKAEAIPILDMLARELENSPEMELRIEGHTDSDPINTPQFPNNWVLSAGRAISVGLYFIEEKGIDPSRVTAAGRGQYSPAAPNDTPENKAKNRRVEITLYGKTEFGLSP